MSGSPVYLDGQARGSAVGDVGVREGAHRAGDADRDRCSRSTRRRGGGHARRARTAAVVRGVFDALVERARSARRERLAALEKIARAHRPAGARAGVSLLAPVVDGIPCRDARAVAEDLGRLGLPASLVSGELRRCPGRPSGAERRASGGADRAGLRAHGSPPRRRHPARRDRHGDARGRRRHASSRSATRSSAREARAPGRRRPRSSRSSRARCCRSSSPMPCAPAYRLTHDRDRGIAGRIGPRRAPRARALPARVGRTARADPLVGRRARAGASSRPSSRCRRTSRSRCSTRRPSDRTLAPPRLDRHGGGPVRLRGPHDRPAREGARPPHAIALAGLVAQNEFEDPQISGVDISIASAPGRAAAARRGRGASRPARSRPGETLSATVRLADRRGSEETRVLSLTVPQETPEGRATSS